MGLPYRIATLLYVFNDANDVLLMHRNHAPNAGLWSPCGGKLETATGESPYACAIREAREEIGLSLSPSDLHLWGLLSEEAYQGDAHWLIFLFEIRKSVNSLPPPHEEGTFRFVPPAQIATLPIPESDREVLWPLLWKHRGGFFSAHGSPTASGGFQWILHESRPLVPPHGADH